jgi:tetratricopeptide (TPR) repeat protein
LQRLLGPDDVQTAILLKRWADNESARGNLQDAEQAYGQALDVLARSRLGELHPLVALLHNSLEVILLRQGRLAEYEQHLRDELRIRLQLEIDERLLVTLNDLVVFLSNQGRYTDAIPIFEVLMEVYRQLIVTLPQTIVIVGGGDHAQQRQQLERQLTEHLAIACRGAAENLSRAGQQDQADALYREALALHENASGQNLHQ